MDGLGHEQLRPPPDDPRPTHDEVHAPHRLVAIEPGTRTARSFGGAVVPGPHSFDKLVQPDSEDGAVHLSSFARTKLIVTRQTAETCSQFIGSREVRRLEEASSDGHNTTRDASTLTPRTLVAPLVVPDEIAHPPLLRGFVNFPDEYPSMVVWTDCPEVANGRQNVKRTEDHAPVPTVEENGADDEAESARTDAHRVPIADSEQPAMRAETDSRADTIRAPSIGPVDGQSDDKDSEPSQTNPAPLPAQFSPATVGAIGWRTPAAIPRRRAAVTKHTVPPRRWTMRRRSTRRRPHPWTASRNDPGARSGSRGRITLDARQGTCHLGPHRLETEGGRLAREHLHHRSGGSGPAKVRPLAFGH